MYIGSLIKVCNVRYIMSYKLQNMKLYTRNAVKYSFLLSCIDRTLNYGLKIQQMVLHAKLVRVQRSGIDTNKYHT